MIMSELMTFLLENNFSEPTIYKLLYTEEYHVLCYDVNKKLVVFRVDDHSYKKITWEKKVNGI